MEQIDQAFYNMPYLMSLNKKRAPLPPNFQLPSFQPNIALYQKITNLQSEVSNDDSIVVDNKSIQVSKIGTDRETKHSFFRLPPNSKTAESLEKIDSNTERKVNMLDEINKDLKDDFQEELVESKEEIPPFEKNQEPEFLFEEQISEKEYKGFIPDLDEEQVRTVENFRDIVDKGGKFNEKLYEFNEALFNKDEARIQRQKTHKIMMKALEHELNKMEKHATKVEKEITEGGEKINEINQNMDVINNDLRKLIYERETEALMRRVDKTLENPLKLSDIFKTKAEGSPDPKEYDSKLMKIFKENDDVFREIDQCMEKFGLDLPNDEYSEIVSQQCSESSNRIIPTMQTLNQTINESMTRKMIEKAKTLEKELRFHRNKKLVSVLESAPTQRNKTSKNTSLAQKNSKPNKPPPKTENNHQPKKPKKGEIKFRGIAAK